MEEIISSLELMNLASISVLFPTISELCQQLSTALIIFIFSCIILGYKQVLW